MAGSVIYYGRRVTSHDSDFAEVGPGAPGTEQRACVYGYLSQTLIVYRLEGWYGREIGTPTSRIFLGATSGGDSADARTPADRLAYTDEISPATVMADIAGGTTQGRDIAPVILTPDYYALGITGDNGTLGVAMRAAANFPASTNTNFYSKALSGTIPTNPIGGASSNEGVLDLWAVGEANVKPNKPTALSPAGTISGGNLSPTFTANFSDPNETLNNGAAFDVISGARIQVIRQSDGHVMWDRIVPPGPTQQANRQSIQAYDGETLAYDVTYRHRVQHQDIAGAWSDWAETTFVIQSGASVDQPTAPQGLVLTQTPGPITAKYHHIGGKSTNAVQVQLLAENYSVIKTSPIITTTVAPEGTISVTWAQCAFPTLSWGKGYRTRVKARDTSNVWSADYSGTRLFYTDTAPLTPTNLWPANGQASTSRPLLSAKTSDPDADRGFDQALTVTATIKNSAGTVVATRTMTLPPGNAFTRTYQTTATDLASFGTYTWTAVASDGTLTSAVSAPATFVYSAGPTVDITAPVSPITTVNPTVVWSATFSGGATQASYRVQMIDPDTSAVVYDSGTLAGSATSYQIDNDHWTGEVWNNGETFAAVVTVTDTNGLSGSTAAYPLTVTYTPPDPITLNLAMTGLPATHGTNAALLSWDQSGVADGWLRYTITRDALTPDLRGRIEPSVTLATLTSQSATAFLDTEITPGVTYRWTLTQDVQQGNDVLTSNATEVTGAAESEGVLLHLPWNPDNYHVELRFGPRNSTFRPQLNRTTNNRAVDPFAGGGRVVFMRPSVSNDPHYEVGCVDDEDMTADERMQAFLAIQEASQGLVDGRPHIVCLRDSRGLRLYGVLENVQPGWAFGPAYDLSFDFREASFALSGEAVS